MKKVFSPAHILYAFGILVAFVVGGMLITHNNRFFASAQKAHIASPLPFCVGTKACKAGVVSVFSKQKLNQVANAAQEAVHSGFCLHVPVLLYHHIQPQSIAQEKGQTSLTVDNGIFDQQMGYLAGKGYHTISAEELVNALVTHSQLPANSIVITLDDGYLDNYVYAYPVLQKYRVIANLMVPTGLLGNTSGANAYFTWDQLKEMVGSGLLFAYNHTWSHFAMGAGPAEKDIFEIKTAQQQLQEHLGKAFPLFVYPYGSGQTVAWVQQLVKENGFLAAFSTLGGSYSCDSNAMALPRVHIGNAPMSSYGF